MVVRRAAFKVVLCPDPRIAAQLALTQAQVAKLFYLSANRDLFSTDSNMQCATMPRRRHFLNQDLSVFSSVVYQVVGVLCHVSANCRGRTRRRVAQELLKSSCGLQLARSDAHAVWNVKKSGARFRSVPWWRQSCR
ncbi:hypothetical protein H310_14354 [Aphanomyces invadans]|uniref:Uncharacterized protein n=1 Tax=Aphanomyces invadans TaxID=157072 RepID=A0A024TAD4_9STRA|nr:hypothetical protein H310_14354 [Aphanomyces invadans]ETV90939.1 hypothetical protein H310_14354 [Aphanomyces invadans]|eukprot:XP_008880421.1 hypothetical protein H310_14354 [Aphanomyces invadans]